MKAILVKIIGMISSREVKSSHSKREVNQGVSIDIARFNGFISI